MGTQCIFIEWINLQLTLFIAFISLSLLTFCILDRSNFIRSIKKATTITDLSNFPFISRRMFSSLLHNYVPLSCKSQVLLYVICISSFLYHNIFFCHIWCIWLLISLSDTEFVITMLLVYLCKLPTHYLKIYKILFQLRTCGVISTGKLSFSSGTFLLF